MCQIILLPQVMRIHSLCCNLFSCKKTHNHVLLNAGMFGDTQSSQRFYLWRRRHTASFLFPSNLSLQFYLLYSTSYYSVSSFFIIIFILLVSHVPYITQLSYYRNYFTFKYRGIEYLRLFIQFQLLCKSKMIYPKKGSQRLTRYA